MRKILSILVMMIGAVAMAEPSITLDVQPRKIHMGESATATLELHGIGNAGAPNLQVDGFQVEFTGQSQNSTFANGVMDSSIAYSYQMTPKRTGKSQVGPFNCNINGKQYAIPAVTVEVVPADASLSDGGHELMFARLEPSTTNIYVQQIFDMVLKIYVSPRLNFARAEALQNLPSHGFDIHQPQELDTIRETVNGDIYNVHRYRVKAQALSAGTFNLEPVSHIQLVSQRRSEAFMLFNIMTTEPYDLAVKPVALVVKDLPAEGRPATFSGAVGNYSFDAAAKPTELTSGDPVTLSFRIAGRGNIENVQTPALNLGEQFRVYDAKLTAQNINGDGTTGDKTFDQVIIPKSPDAKQIPAIVFAFFNPEAGIYQTISKGPFALNVKPATNNARSLIVENQGTPNAAAAQNEILGSDIVYLKPAPRNFGTAGDIAWFERPAVLATQAAPAFALALVFFAIRRRDQLAGDISKARRQAAPKAARAGIARANAALAANDAAKFYEALWDALASYFGNRLNLAPGDVSQSRVDAAFATANFEGEQRSFIRDLFATCDQARFAGGSATFDADAAHKLVTGLEDALRACEKIKF